MARYNELKDLGINVKLLCIGKKGYQFFMRRPQFTVEGAACGGAVLPGRQLGYAGKQLRRAAGLARSQQPNQGRGSACLTGLLAATVSTAFMKRW